MNKDVKIAIGCFCLALAFVIFITVTANIMTKTQCPNCETVVKNHFNYCPECGFQLRNTLNGSYCK